MSLRAIFIIPAEEGAEVPSFSKYFHTVETRCKARSGKLYVKIPPEKEFVKLLFTETGIENGAGFVEVRDHCDKEFSNPAFQLKTEFGILWPVIVILYKGFIYCGITFEENFKINLQSGSMKLGFMASVTMCLEVLNGLSHCVDYSCSSQGKIDAVEMLKYISCALPFGRPTCSSPSIAMNFPLSVWRGKGKQPAWNPLQYKGKSNVILSVKEEIRCIQLNQRDVVNPVDVYGTIMCSSEAEGISPEISLVLTNPSEHKCGFLVNACVSSLENISSSSTRLRFHPTKSQNLCIYKMKSNVPPPVSATFSLKVKEDIVNVSVQLKLQNGVKNVFQIFEVHIPFNCTISAIRSHCSQGSVVIGSRNTLIWKIGTKLPSKTLEASLLAKARIKIKESEKSSEQTTVHHTGDKQALLNVNSLSEMIKCIYASVIFTIQDYVYSGIKIDPQSVIVTTSAKVNRSVSYACSAGDYKIWNNDNSENFMDDELIKEFTTVLGTR